MDLQLLLKLTIPYLPVFALTIGVGISGLVLAGDMRPGHSIMPCEQVKINDLPCPAKSSNQQSPILSQKVMILTYSDISNIEIPNTKKLYLGMLQANKVQAE